MSGTDAARAREALRQQALVGALLRDAAAPPLAGWLRGEAGAVARGLQAHASHAGVAAERALAAAFPTVRALVGEDAFAALARAHWQARPPARGDLALLGASLPDFIEADAQLAGLAYLADCARLDALLAAAEAAADADLDADSLQRLAAADPRRLALVLMPGTALLASRWPVATLHAAHAAEGEAREAAFAVARAALAAGEDERVLVWRRGWRAHAARLSEAEAAFVAALLAGESLGAALDAAGAGFDFAAWLARALEAGWLRRVEPRDAEGAPC